MGSFCHHLKHWILFTPIFMGVCKVGKAFPCLLTPCFSLAKPAMIIQQVLNNLVPEKERILYFQVTGMNKLPDLGNHWKSHQCQSHCTLHWSIRSLQDLKIKEHRRSGGVQHAKGRDGGRNPHWVWAWQNEAALVLSSSAELVWDGLHTTVQHAGICCFQEVVRVGIYY